jgi:superfamily I DNA/RNA helicase
MSKVTGFIAKEVSKQVQALYQRGGNFQKAAEKVKALLYDIKNKPSEVVEILSKIPLTNHGESRIQHCIKYDLPGRCRLVTIKNNGWIVLLYFGSHDEVEGWIDKNRGLQVAIEDLDKGLYEVFVSENINDPDARINPESDFSGGKLFEKLKHYYKDISANLPALIKRIIERFDTSVEEDEILEASTAIADPSLGDVVFDVFMLLRAGMIDEAKNRINAYKDQLTLLQDLEEEKVQEVMSNDQFLKIDDLDAEDMHLLMNNKDWLEWMLFMHPAQKVVVDKDFNGSARLLGVSGSGKTCVVVRRAIRLAKKYPGEKILILTLNQSLSGLIVGLVDKLIKALGENEIKEYIVIKSFWELCKELVIEFRQHPFDKRVLGWKTDKHEESVDDIWEEYYRCNSNNNDADVLFPVHGGLLSRGIYPLDYIKQEFDWIRSFLPQCELHTYKTIEREGRSISLTESEKEKILKGLAGWELKMKDIGVIDYLGLANELYKYIDKVKPSYKCILVDEVQDFGTLELKIIRNLVEEGENDLFITGDIAQQVYNKQHKIRSAGINIAPNAYLTILKNYRNSREILSAACEIFKNNTREDQYKTEDFEILKPEYANFSSARPFSRSANNLNEEFSYALKYLKEILLSKEKGCIAICGCTLFEVQDLAKSIDLPVLDGSTKLSDEKVYLSDLEQTKGFEFDRMIIINANAEIIPNPTLPKEEWFREISKFYVAMTRAKKELIVSYSSRLSPLFEGSESYFNIDEWNDHVSELGEVIKIPKTDKSKFAKCQATKMVGKDFLYHKKAVGMSRELQNKLFQHVKGKSVSLKGKKIEWLNMEGLKAHVLSKTDIPHLNKLFGPVVYKELEELFSKEVKSI